jgi:aspartyl-tRNA(Asn)/glutamyl-tRNA(Gln) amidotransferase subunit B
VAEARDLIQISDTSVLQAVIDEVLAANPEALDRYRAGESKVLGFLVGQVMRASGGKAEPKQVNDLLRQRLR